MSTRCQRDSYISGHWLEMMSAVTRSLSVVRVTVDSLSNREEERFYLRVHSHHQLFPCYLQ